LRIATSFGDANAEVTSEEMSIFKRPNEYFEGLSIKELFDTLQTWQLENKTLFLM
jgi:hypothetical protein